MCFDGFKVKPPTAKTSVFDFVMFFKEDSIYCLKKLMKGIEEIFIFLSFNFIFHSFI